MKIYFEDGRLQDHLYATTFDYVIDAGDGYSFCDDALSVVMRNGPTSTVYTNFIPALSNMYAWNSEEKAPEIYIRNKKGAFVRIDTLTTRELKEGHNIMKMYMANEFGNLG